MKPATTVIGKVPHLTRLLLRDEKGYFYFKAVFVFLCFLTMGGFLIVVYMTDFSHGTTSEQAPIDFSRLFRYGSTQKGIAALSYNQTFYLV